MTTLATPDPAARPEAPHTGVGERPGLREELPSRLVLENTIVGISYMHERRFVWANERMAEIFGYAHGALNGLPVRLLYASQEDYDAVAQMMQSFPPDGFYTHERAMARRDGSLVWCSISGRFIRPEDPRSPSVWVVQDLSDRKRAEDELRRINRRLEHMVELRTTNLRRSNEALRSEVERRRKLQADTVQAREKYRALFRHLPLGVLAADESGEIVEVNRTLQQYLGAPNKRRLEALLHDPAGVVANDGFTGSLAGLVRHWSGRIASRVLRFEFAWHLSPRGTREIAVIGAPLLQARRGVVFTFVDMTEQRQRLQREHEQQAALTHASRLSLMGQMASALAHELGQPLNACQSYLAGIRHRLDGELSNHPELCEALDRVAAHLDQAGDIIRHVRGFVSRHQPEFENLPLQHLLEQTLVLLEPPLRATGTLVSTHVEGPSPLVRCHPVEIQQVLVNLVINAVEAMVDTPPHERRIEIRVSQERHGMVAVAVTDHGPGVSAGLLPRLFDPYVTSKPDGLGMGLMISRTIVESHGGALRHLPGPHGGAVFQFTLQQMPPASAVPAPGGDALP